MLDVNYKFVTKQHLEELKYYTAKDKLSPEKMSKEDENAIILGKWVLKIEKLATADHGTN